MHFLASAGEWGKKKKRETATASQLMQIDQRREEVLQLFRAAPWSLFPKPSLTPAPRLLLWLHSWHDLIAAPAIKGKQDTQVGQQRNLFWLVNYLWTIPTSFFFLFFYPTSPILSSWQPDRQTSNCWQGNGLWLIFLLIVMQIHRKIWRLLSLLRFLAIGCESFRK